MCSIDWIRLSEALADPATRISDISLSGIIRGSPFASNQDRHRGAMGLVAERPRVVPDTKSRFDDPRIQDVHLFIELGRCKRLPLKRMLLQASDQPPIVTPSQRY